MLGIIPKRRDQSQVFYQEVESDRSKLKYISFSPPHALGLTIISEEREEVGTDPRIIRVAFRGVYILGKGRGTTGNRNEYATCWM